MNGSVAHAAVIALLTAFSLSFVGAAGAVDIYKPCDTFRGFNYKTGQYTRIGFVTSLTIGGVPGLRPDIIVKDPMNPASNLTVFAVLNDAGWGAGATEPIQLSAQVSAANRRLIEQAIGRGLTQVDTMFSFVVYEHDRSTRRYFKAFHGGAQRALQGSIENHGGQLGVSVGNVPGTTVRYPENYAFSISIIPASVQQQVHLAVSETQQVAKQWGVIDRR